jgi:hypothetical protein
VEASRRIPIPTGTGTSVAIPLAGSADITHAGSGDFSREWTINERSGPRNAGAQALLGRTDYAGIPRNSLCRGQVDCQHP